MRRRCEEVEREGLLAKKFSRTLSRNLKKGVATAGKLGALSPPTSATGHLAAAHFRDRPPRGRSLPRAAKRKSSCTAGNAKYPGYWDAPNIPLRRQVGMKNCRTSAREAYTIRRGAISVFAQDAPRTARPLRAQVGMKNCRISAREAYIIR